MGEVLSYRNTFFFYIHVTFNPDFIFFSTKIISCRQSSLHLHYELWTSEWLIRLEEQTYLCIEFQCQKKNIIYYFLLWINKSNNKVIVKKRGWMKWSLSILSAKKNVTILIYYREIVVLNWNYELCVQSSSLTGLQSHFGGIIPIWSFSLKL